MCFLPKKSLIPPTAHSRTPKPKAIANANAKPPSIMETVVITIAFPIIPVLFIVEN